MMKKILSLCLFLGMVCLILPSLSQSQIENPIGQNQPAPALNPDSTAADTVQTQPIYPNPQPVNVQPAQNIQPEQSSVPMPPVYRQKSVPLPSGYGQNTVQLQPGNGSKTTTITGNSDAWLAETKKGIAIMEKIFDHSLTKEFNGEYETGGFFSSGCQGYWIPDQGVLFKIKVKFPLKSMETVKDATQEEPKDLWSEFSEEVDGKKQQRQESQAWFGKVDDLPKDPYDPGKTKRLETIIFQILAEYGNRLQGFPDQEKFVLLLEGEGGDNVMDVFADTNNRQFRYAKRGERFGQSADSDTDKLQKEMEMGKKDMQLAQKEKAIQLQQQIAEQAQRAASIGSKVATDIAKGLSNAGISEASEWAKSIPSPETIEKYIPNQDEIKKWIPNPETLRRYQGAVKMFTPLLGQDSSHEKTRMVIQATFADIQDCKGDPKRLQSKVKITTY